MISEGKMAARRGMVLSGEKDPIGGIRMGGGERETAIRAYPLRREKLRAFQ